MKLNNMGEATVVIANADLKKHKLIEEYGGSSVRILATVTEDLTDIQRNGTAQVSILILNRWSCVKLSYRQ